MKTAPFSYLRWCGLDRPVTAVKKFGSLSAKSCFQRAWVRGTCSYVRKILDLKVLTRKILRTKDLALIILSKVKDLCIFPVTEVLPTECEGPPLQRTRLRMTSVFSAHLTSLRFWWAQSRLDITMAHDFPVENVERFWRPFSARGARTLKRAFNRQSQISNLKSSIINSPAACVRTATSCSELFPLR